MPNSMEGRRKSSFKESFSSRLSLKTVTLGNILFLVALVVLAYFGGKMVNHRSIRYAYQCLHTTVLEVQSTFESVEKSTNFVAYTTDALVRGGDTMDTLHCYPILERILSQSSPCVIGCGLYFEPHSFNKDDYYCGIYVNRDTVDGKFLHEWDDDDACSTDGWDYFNLDWYKTARDTDEAGWTSPALENMTTYYQLLTSYSCPIHDKNGKFLGVFSTDISLDFLEELMRKIRPFENCNVVLMDENYNYICNPMSENPFSGSIYDTPMIPGMSHKVKDIEIMDANGSSMMVTEGLKRAFIVSDVMSNGWILAVAVRYKDAAKDMLRLWLLLLGIAVIGCTLLYVSSRKMIHKETRPLVEYAKAASKITEGRFDVPIPEVKYDDEIKDLGDALRYMQVSVTNYIAELEKTTSEKERLASELNVAHDIQNHMLTKVFPAMQGCGIYARSIPAKEVGGDLFDFYIHENSLFFMLGDVSGKGVPAALMMAITIAAFRATIKGCHSTAEVVSQINETFCKSNEDMMFVTVVVGRLDMNTGKVEFCNGGHNPMVLCKPDGTSQFIQAKSNIACGAFPKFSYEEDSFVMEEGSRLIIYSDGVTEAETVTKDQYSEPRLLGWAEGNATKTDLSDEECVEALIGDVKKFTAEADQNDDITVMSISR